jgi:hypothetical protein
VKGRAAMTADELTNEGFALVSEILRAALNLNAVPDWFEVEIRGNSYAVAGSQRNPNQSRNQNSDEP